MQMATLKFSVALLFQLILLAFFICIASGQGLKVGFYKKTCPNVEAICKENNGSSYGSCTFSWCPFGCEGSVLLNSTRNNQAEKDSFPNLSLEGFQIIDRAKSAVERACPGVVSCADIVALAARDATVSDWQVETGLKDGRVSMINEALTNLPSSLDKITTLLQRWQQKGSSRKDLVVLSGGHTIGTFDKHYYTLVSKRRGFFNLIVPYLMTLRQGLMSSIKFIT